MAAKKLQEYVKGKMNSSNIGSIHFSAHSPEDKRFVNLATKEMFMENKGDKFTDDFFYSMSEPGDGISIHQIAGEDRVNAIPSSTKSSPGLKPRWSGHIAEVKSAVEDAYSTVNAMVKERTSREAEVPGRLSTSSTMPNMEQMAVTEEEEMVVLRRGVDSGDGARKTSSTRGTAATMRPERTRLTQDDDSNYGCAVTSQVHRRLVEQFQTPRSMVVKQRPIGLSGLGSLWLLAFLLPLLVLAWLTSYTALIFIAGAASAVVLLQVFGLLQIPSLVTKTMQLPLLCELPTPQIPHITETNREDLDVHSSPTSCFSGWANIMGHYDVSSYNLNRCCVVHLDIETGSSSSSQPQTSFSPLRALRVRRVKRGVARRALWNEGSYSAVAFSGDVLIPLEGVRLDLLPAGLVHKRLWSKKYPIRLLLPKPLSEYRPDKALLDVLPSSATELFLFGRTCRDKEEWFRRLGYACQQDRVELNMWNIVQQYLTHKSVSSGDGPTTIVSSTGAAAAVTPSGPIANPRSSGSVIGGATDEEGIRKVTYNRCDEDVDSEDGGGGENLCIETKAESKKLPQMAEYVKYMSKFMPADMFLLTAQVMRLNINYVSCGDEMLALNALLGRVFWDFLRGPHWADLIRNKIQCKLKKIHLPQFMDQLKVVDIHLGEELPLIRRFGRPFLNSRGIWVDADIAYSGGCSMILETKVNLFNLRNQARRRNEENGCDENGGSGRSDEGTENSPSSGTASSKTAAYQSSEEDSADSSTNSEGSGDERSSASSATIATRQSDSGTSSSPTTASGVSNGGTQAGSAAAAPQGGGSKRLLRWVDKIAKNPYFIKAADNKYVQRGMELVSNTKLMLQVEVHSFSGCLALNIAPPPSDRLWYGFRPQPHIELSAKPKVGQKEISFTRITEFIEKKLLLEFQRVLVLPNMDDVALPLLVNGKAGKYPHNL